MASDILAEADEADEKSANEAERKSAGFLEKMYNKLFNKDKEENENKSSGLLGKIKSGIGGLLGFLSGGSGILSKIGFGAKLLGGVSLFGHASEWFKKTILPGLKSLFFGDENDPNDGIWGAFKKTSVGSFFANIAESVGKKGFWGYLAEDVIPPMIDNMVVGWGYAMENVVAPLTAAIVKNLPELFTSLVSGIWKGITSAFNSKFGDGKIEGKEEKIELKNDYVSSVHKEANNRISGGVSNTVKSYLGTSINGNYSSSGGSNLYSSSGTKYGKKYDINGNEIKRSY